MQRRQVLFGCATALPGITGCLDSEPPVDSAFVSFSEDSDKGVGVEVSKGDFESLWIEIENVDGGFMIYEGVDRPSIYINDDEYYTAGDICYKKSFGADCVEGSLDEETQESFYLSAEIRVYGILDGEQTLLETYAHK
ncbi:hypothetical protein [Natronosalvus rutilus]|uniref:Lipoprotein n=1 Tax=Natronosalvus rutilus TaxID=2953753 RepID=A0A9E7SXT4_9EURY|nr:hypothetical protein [Natronosalvus rutilus]UTF55391.1 hypothetical protein NGM29_09125 [Natronosalvus rutilus]